MQGNILRSIVWIVYKNNSIIKKWFREPSRKLRLNYSANHSLFTVDNLTLEIAQMHEIKGTKTPTGYGDLWGTDPRVVNNLNKEFNFNLDAYASFECHFFNRYIIGDANNENWLVKGMPATVFCNPPYSPGEIPKCLKSAWRESQKGATAVVIIPMQVSKYWNELVIGRAAEVRIIVGRINFIHPTTHKLKSGASGGLAVIVFRPNYKGNTYTSYISSDSLIKG